MTRRMLINSTHPEETRVAIANEEYLEELEVERADQVLQRGNIFKARITRIEPSLQAAFLDIGSSRNGFLQINDIHPAYYGKPGDESPDSSRNRPHIQDVLEAGEDLIVQVVKDERDAKGATLTTNLSIPGRYLVLMVGNQRGGVSRKIADEGQRSRLRRALRDLRVPQGMGVIVRTAGINKTGKELQGDLNRLLDIWYGIVERSYTDAPPTALYKESSLSIRTIRDYLSTDIEEIFIDNKAFYDEAVEFVERIMPNYSSRVKHYDDSYPLFSRYNLDAQIEATNQPEVTLPSGGSIVINQTEAIVAVDVNSGRSTGQSDVEETAFATNKEAATEVARQLRLRDMGGLVVIDFIDMNDRRHKSTVEKTLKDSVKSDKAKVEVGRISKFGLLEMSRQRLKSSLVSQSQSICASCNGRGRTKTLETTAIEAYRKIQSTAYAGGMTEVRARMSPGVALFMLNNKRRMLSEIEQHTGVSILVFADGRMRSDQYEILLNTDSKEDPSTTERSASDSRGRNSRGRGRRSNSRSKDNRSGDSRGRGRRRSSNNRSRGRRSKEDSKSDAPTEEATTKESSNKETAVKEAPVKESTSPQAAAE